MSKDAVSNNEAIYVHRDGCQPVVDMDEFPGLMRVIKITVELIALGFKGVRFETPLNIPSSDKFFTTIHADLTTPEGRRSSQFHELAINTRNPLTNLTTELVLSTIKRVYREDGLELSSGLEN